MAEFKRSNFKASSLSAIKDEQGRAEKAVPKNKDFGNRPGFHTVEEGKNWRRIAPAHSPDEPAYRAKSTAFLECEVPEVDKDGKETGKKEVLRKQIFIATQHSLVLKEDPILLYIQFVQKRAADEIQDKDERIKFLSPINGWRGKDKKWNWGIKPGVEYVCYAWDDAGELGREQLYSKMLDEMKRISVKQAPDGAEIIPDIFTDPDEGFPLIITKEKNDKGKFEVTVDCEILGKKETWAEFFERTRLTDEQLADLMSKESLRELYEDVYTSRDFNMALDGLQRFDKEHKFEIFENEEFLDKLTELKSLVPAYVPKEAKEDEPESRDEKEVKAMFKDKKEVAKETTSDLIVPVPKMKNFVKAYIQENYGSDFHLPDPIEKETLIEWYALAQKGEELPFEDEKPKEEEPKASPKADKKKDKDPIKDKSTEVDPALAQQIAALRKSRKNK